MTHNLLYLTEHSLNDRLFMREFFAKMTQMPGKTLLVHGTSLTDIAQIRFLSKRVSAHLSESMVSNSPISGDQRKFIKVGGQKVTVRASLLHDLFAVVDCIVLNTVATNGFESVIIPTEQLLVGLRETIPFDYCITFPLHSSSALGAPPKLLSNEAERQQLLAAYDEESTAIETAYLMKPCFLALPKNFVEVTVAR
jgi:hypothetical protein